MALSNRSWGGDYELETHTFVTRPLSRGTAITDVQHLLGHASVKTIEKAFATFLQNERSKQTIDLLDTPIVPHLKVVK